MRVSRLWFYCVALAFVRIAGAQLSDPDPDWKELDAATPPAFEAQRVILLDMPKHLTTRVGVDPDTLQIGSDGIVRYVVVMQSPSGSVNASYEGLRCLTGEVKVYARHGSSAKWTPVAKPEWRPLNSNQPSPHALALARQGVCDGRSAPAVSVSKIISNLKTSLQSVGNR